MSLAAQFEDGQSFTPSSDVLFQEVSGEIVLLDLASESYFGLDPVGASIWGLLNQGLSMAQMMDALMQEYEVDRDTLKADLEELICQLFDAGLIKLTKLD